MLAELVRNWWVFLIRGIAAILFGITAFVWPELTLTVLILMFGAYSLVDGIFTVIAGISARRVMEHWWTMLISGISGIIFGILTFIWPGMTALILLYFIAAWAIVTGIFQIAAAIRLRKVIEGEWALGLGGAAGILLGILLIAMPGAGALASIWTIGAFAILFGILMIVVAFRLRGWRDTGFSASMP
jgi:uncharacterized membrane protein HdeD (DUF308 family)